MQTKIRRKQQSPRKRKTRKVKLRRSPTEKRQKRSRIEKIKIRRKQTRQRNLKKRKSLSDRTRWRSLLRNPPRLTSPTRGIQNQVEVTPEGGLGIRHGAGAEATAVVTAVVTAEARAESGAVAAAGVGG